MAMSAHQAARCIALPVLVLAFALPPALAQTRPDSSDSSIHSSVVSTAADELVLIQEVEVAAPVDLVWAAYTTQEGWTAWASPVAEIDLRAGGTIRTHYGTGAAIGDPGTNTLHIVNYVPERLLTLRAEVSERWPEIMRADAEHLMNVVVFVPESSSQTRILSYGVGYRDADAYAELMGFFIQANEQLFSALKTYLEGE